MSTYHPPPSAGGGGGGGSGDVVKADIAQNVQFNAVMWISGATYYGKDTNTNVVVASGIEPGEVFRQTVTTVGTSPNHAVLLIKEGNYSFTSGIFLSGNYATLYGEGIENTILDFSNPTAKVSGCLRLAGTGQELANMTIQLTSGFYSAVHSDFRSHLNIHNLELFGFNETISGIYGLKFNNNGDALVQNVDIYSFNTGIDDGGSQGMHYQDIYAEGFGTLIKLTGSASRNNTIEHVDATATSFLSGVVGLVNSANRNSVRDVQASFSGPGVYLDSNSGTNRNRISAIINTGTQGVEILDNSPGKNFIGAYYPEVGIADTARFTIWVSGGIYQALRNNDGILIASGTNSANVFKTVMDAVGTSFDGMVHVKNGDYSFTSGWSIVGGVTVFGDPGGGTVFDFNSQSGLISGAIRISGVRAALRDVDIFGLSGVTPVIYTSDTTVEIDNVDIDSNTGTPASGHIGIHIAGGQGDTTLRNVSVQSHDIGIYLASGSNGLFQSSANTIIDDVRIGNGRCGILLDSSVENIITNVIGDSTLTSGTVRLINMSNNNVIDNIIGVAV